VCLYTSHYNLIEREKAAAIYLHARTCPFRYIILSCRGKPNGITEHILKKRKRVYCHRPFWSLESMEAFAS
jgi:hypothetical protein